MQIVNLSDIELVELLQKGNQKAYEVIYKKYWRALYSFVHQLVGSKEDTEEVLHDLMLSLWINRHKANIQNLKVYLFVAARNLSNKSISSKINMRKYKEFQILNEVFENYNTDDIVNAKDLSEAIDLVLSSMPQKTLQIFKMCKLEEMPIKKIATQLNLTDKAVEYHITKSMKVLKDTVKKPFFNQLKLFSMTNHEYDLLFEKFNRQENSNDELEFLEKWANDHFENSLLEGNDETKVLEKKIWINIEKSLSQIEPCDYKIRRIHLISRKSVTRLIITLAACLMVVIGYVFVSNFTQTDSFDLTEEKQGIESKNIANKIQKVILPDNSLVWLERNARIITDENYGKTNRTVYLEGEAHFEVKSNPQKPFLVLSSGLVTEVLGTVFRIKPQPLNNTIEVSVQKGKVSVYTSENKTKNLKRNGVILTPNQKGTFDTRDKTIQHGIVETPIIIQSEIQKTTFIFDEETLGKLIERLENAYGVEILVSNPTLNECVFTGDLNNLSLFKQLEFVCGSINAQYETRGSTIFIVGQGCKTQI